STAPGSARSSARWMPRLSPAGMPTVTAGPANGSPTSKRTSRTRCRRPAASCSVATPSSTSRAARKLLERVLDQGSRVGDVLPDHLRDRPRLARPHGLRDRDVLAGRGERGDVAAHEDDPVAVGPFPEPVERLDQQVVARTSVDRAVTGAVAAQLL